MPDGYINRTRFAARYRIYGSAEEVGDFMVSALLCGKNTPTCYSCQVALSRDSARGGEP
jgi:hypothetical protein